MNVALVGNNDGPLVLLHAMRAAGLKPVCVGLQKPPPEPLRRRYEDRLDGVPYVEGFDEDGLLDHLAPHRPSLLVNAFCNFRFRRLLEAYDVLNLHLAPLPRYRGRHPLPWALINGERRFGVTIHAMTEAWDAGPIWWQRAIAVDDGSSVRELRQRLLDAVESDFGRFLTEYAGGTIEPRPNRDAEATYVARRFPEDSRLVEWRAHDVIVRKVQALRSEQNPAFFEVGAHRFLAHAAVAGSRRYAGLAAPFICAVADDAVEVVCLDGHTVVLGGLAPPPLDLHVNDRIRT